MTCEQHAYIDAARALRSKLGGAWDVKRPVRVGLSKRSKIIE